MSIVLRILPIAVAVVLRVYLFHLLRSRSLQQRYVYLWSFLIGGVTLLALWPQAAISFATFIGFETAANLLLSFASFILLISLISNSVSVSALERDKEKLVEDIALLEERISTLEEKNF